MESDATWGLDRIDQEALPLDGEYNYNDTIGSGQGVKVYIVDTGIYRDHAEFGGRAVFGADFVAAGGDAIDCNGHGTHVRCGTALLACSAGAAALIVRHCHVGDCHLCAIACRSLARSVAPPTALRRIQRWWQCVFSAAVVVPLPALSSAALIGLSWTRPRRYVMRLGR
jgi:subtilisin family serine protease